MTPLESQIMASVATATPPTRKATVPALATEKLFVHNKVKQGEAEVFTERVQVTPDLARALLANNPSNRKLSVKKVAEYADDMQNNRWMFNGENIIVAKSGELNDGQHRLLAVIESGMPQHFNITFGVNRGSRFTVDTGRMRATKDQAQLKGFNNPTELSSVTRMVISYEKTNRETLGKDAEVSIQLVLERAGNDRALLDAINFAAVSKARMKKVMPAAISGFCYYWFCKKDKRKGKEFMESIRDGNDLPRNSPIFVARERLMGSQLTKLEKTEMLFRAFNLYLKGVPAGRINLRKALPKVGE